MSCEGIPSLLDLQKVKKHADDFGRLMGTGTGVSTNEVTGQVRPTYNAVMSNLGYTRIGTFATGATLLNGRQTLLWDIADGGDGQEYGWSGSFLPSGKVVPPGSTPASTGGIAVGAWMSRFDPELRVQVREALRRSYAEAGYNLIGRFGDTGLIVNFASDVLLWGQTGIAYVYSGALPHTVANGETPFGNPLWVAGGSKIVMPTTQALLNADWLTVGDVVETLGFYTEGDFGAAKFQIVSSVYGGATGFGSHNLPNGLVALHIIRRGELNVLEYGIQPGVVTAGVQAAVNNYGVQELRFNAGVYQLENVLLRSNLTLQGISRDVSILQTKSGSNAYLMGIARTSPNPDNNVKNVTLNDLHLKGNLLEGAEFDEHIHCFHASGFTNLYFNRCKVSEFRGDGIYLGAGTSSSLETYNYNFVANDLLIDGINNQNRNGISVITIDGFHLSNFKVLNTAREDMPGAIDFEPNGHNWYVIKNINIRDGVIGNCSNGIHFLNGNQNLSPARDVHIEGVSFSECKISDIVIYRSRAVNDQFTAAQNINIKGCSGNAGATPFAFRGIVGVNVRDCDWKSYTSQIKIGESSNSGEPTLDPLCNVFDVQIQDCSFQSVGTGSNFMAIGRVANLSFVRNKVRNCSNETSGILFNFIANKETSNIRIDDNFFYKNIGLGRGGIIAYHESGHVTTEESNTFLRNVLDMPDIETRFKAYRTDVVSVDPNRFTGSTSPSAFKNGVSVTRTTINTGLPSGKTNGHLSVIKNQLTTALVDLSVRMQFVEDATGEVWSKTATSGTAWSGWRQIC